MFDSIRKFLEEKLADINPFDGGQTGATVRANRANPAQARPAPQSSQVPRFNSGAGAFNVPNTQLRPQIKQPKLKVEIPKPTVQPPRPKPGVIDNSGVVNFPNGNEQKPQVAAPTNKVFNPKPIPQVEQAKPSPAIKPTTSPGFDDAGKFVLGGTAKALNTAGAGVAIAGTKLSDYVSSKLYSGEKLKGIQSKNAENIRRINDSVLKPGSGIFGAGGAMSSDDIQKGDSLDALKKGAASGAAVASEVYAPAKGTSLAVKGGALIPKVKQGAIEGALAGAAGSTGSQALEKGSVDPLQVAQDTAVSAAIGGGIPAVARGVAKAANAARESTPKPTTKLGPSQNVPDETISSPKLVSENRMGGSSSAPESNARTMRSADTTLDRPAPVRSSVMPGMAEPKLMSKINTPEAKPVKSVPTTKLVTPRPTRLDEVIESRIPKRGTDFAKPRESFKMTQGRLDQEQGGTILSESAGGTQRRRMMINPETGVNEAIIETRNPDGSWTRSADREPVIEHRDDIAGVNALERNEEIQRATAQAIKDGREIHLFADKGSGDPKALGTAVHELDPDKHIIDGGFVRDVNTNQILGNHIVVDDTGMHVNVGKSMVNMDAITGDPAKWKNLNKSTFTMDRILEAAAPNDTTYRRVRSFIVDHKQKAEADMRTELKQFRENVANARELLLSVKPRGVKTDDYFTDIFRYAEKKLAQEAGIADGQKLTQEQILEVKYGAQAADLIMQFDNWARAEYDSLLDRTNEVLRRFGHDEVPKRQNYMTHLQEDSLWDKIGIGEDLFRDMTAGIQGEANMHNRGKLPGNIAGLTAEFQPTKKYNPFHQTRRGKDSMTDPFRAMDAYGEASLFNIHMTESAVRARSLESVFRAAEEITNKDMLKRVNEDLRKTLKQSLGGTRSDLISAFQEYANTLTGKSNHFDRAAQDKYGTTGRVALRISRMLQKIAAQSSIAGNFSVTIAQTLNLPNNIGTNGTMNVIRGIGRTLKDVQVNGEPKFGSPASRSNFLRVRYTDAQSRVNQPFMRRMNDTVSKMTLMPAVERAFVELTWNSSYENALKKGFQGRAAVQEADRIAERIIGGRGIADQPDLYRSTAWRGLLQYTLEVNAALKNVRHDMTPMGVARYAAAVFALNYAVEQVTGRAPLPDPVGATVDSIKDFANTDSYADADGDGNPDDTVGEKALRTGQRFATEAVKMVPWASSLSNVLLDQDAKKALFGEDSDLSRYDGSPAGAAVVGKMIQAFDALIHGETDAAIDDGLAAVPFGGQIRKTTQGLSAMSEGVAKNGSGDVTAAVDTSNPLTWVQAALFGKNAIPEVRAYFANDGKSLSDNQGEIFNEIAKSSGEDAKAYVESIFSGRGNTGGSAESETRSPELAELKATEKVKIQKGDWKLEDGFIVDKNGEVKRDHYKQMANALADVASDEAYDAFMKGYGLLDPPTKGEKDPASSTGNEMYDALLQKDASEDKAQSKASAAVGMFSNDKKYKDVPDWVKERFYEESGFTRDDVEYAALTKVDKDVKLESFYRPFAEKYGHDALIDELYKGRTKSIYNDYIMAQDSILTALRNEGLISKEEAKYLKAIKLDRNGEKVEDKSASTGGGGKRGGRKGSKGKSKKGKFDYKLFGFARGKSNSKELYDILKKAKV